MRNQQMPPNILGSDCWPCSDEGLQESVSEAALLHVQAVYPLVMVLSLLRNFVYYNIYPWNSVEKITPTAQQGPLMRLKLFLEVCMALYVHATRPIDFLLSLWLLFFSAEMCQRREYS